MWIERKRGRGGKKTLRGRLGRNTKMKIRSQAEK